jgi:hypothetical protein
MNIFSGSILYYGIVFVLILLSAGTAYFIYRNEDLSKFKKAVLVFLRTVSLFLILFLFLNPYTEYRKKSTVKPANIVLIDKSLSETLENRNAGIPDALKKLESGNSGLKYFLFGSKLLKQVKEYSDDSSLYYKYSTNLARALDGINAYDDLTVNSFTVISDGQINDGNNLIQTAQKFNVPFHYILTGDTVQKKDLVLRRINYNKQVFVNSLSKVFVTVNSYGYDKEIKVNLYENDVKIKTNAIKTNTGIYDYETFFDLISSNQDIKKYKIEIESSDDEITKINNSEIFYVKYVDNSIKVLMIAGSPSYDISAIKHAFSTTENFKADYRIQKQSNEYYDGDLPDFRNYDVLVLNGFPTDITSEEQISAIKKKLNDYNIPLIFINSSNISFDKLREFQNNLPFIVNDISKKEFRSNLRITSNDVTAKADQLRKFNVYPQSFFYKEAFSVKPNSTILGLTVQNNEPAIVVDNTSGTRSAGFLGYGFYKWNLNQQGNYNFLQGLVSTLINLTVDESTKERFILKANKDYFAVSENILFTSYFKDSDPLKKYSVKLTIAGGSKSELLELNQTNKNNFEGDYTPFEKGDYTVKGDLYENGNYIASNSLKLSTGDAIQEFKDTKASDEILKELAYRTKGENLTNKNRQDIAEVLKVNTGKESTVSEKGLFRSSFLYLILIIVLLSIEWYIRKRSNLV